MYDAAQTSRCQACTVPVSRFTANRNLEKLAMLETIAVVLLILWALGLVSSYTMGGFIHVLLVLALVVIVIRVIQGRRI
jgi:fatty-acid desaturase